MSEEAVAVEVLELLNGELEAPNRAMDLDEIRNAGTLPPGYIELTVTRRFAGDDTDRRCGRLGTESYRLGTRSVGDTVTSARAMRLVEQSLEFHVFTVDGKQSSPTRFEGQNPIAPDEGKYSGRTTWTLTF